MEIKGMDYNTHRTKMRMPEYGRSIHLMIEHCKTIEKREERQACAEDIVKTMKMLRPDLRVLSNHKQLLWDHLAIMSNFELDIDYPYDVTSAEKVSQRPAPLPISKHRIPVRHYGNLVFRTLDYICEMEQGEERDALIRLIANHMKRNLMMYGNATPDNERIISDIAEFTKGKVQLDPEKFKFDYIAKERKQQDRTKGKGKKH